MKRIVLTTSSSSLDNYDIKTDIRQVRLHIHIGDTDLIDGKDIDRKRLIDLISKDNNDGIYTSPVTESEIREVFEEIFHEGYDEVLVITLSSKISKSHDIISKVAQDFKDRIKIMLFDSKEINGCEALLALEADYLLKKGRSISDVWLELSELRSKHKTLFAVKDISQLVRNKKISTTSAFFANLFDIKPVLHLSDDGEIVPLNKIRSFDKATKFMLDQVKDSTKYHNDDFLYVLSAGNQEITQEFVSLVKETLNIEYLPVLPASSISIANHGVNGIGLCIFRGAIPSLLEEMKL